MGFMKNYFEAVLDRYKRTTEILTCKHDWELYYDSSTLTLMNMDSKQRQKIKHTFICKECGQFKQIYVE